MLKMGWSDGMGWSDRMGWSDGMGQLDDRSVWITGWSGCLDVRGWSNNNNNRQNTEYE